MDVKLVWHAQLAERDWIRFLLDGVITEEIDDPSFSWRGDDAIHVVSGNATPLSGLQPWLDAIARSDRDVTLFQVSDEWFSGGYDIYRAFDRVVRNHGTWLARGNGILTLPLGLPNGMLSHGSSMPASQRPHVWSFAGEVKASRREMVDAFKETQPSFCLDTMTDPRRLDRPAYRRMIAEAQFLPCPMGNVMLETWRLYEALELGAIPIAERRLTLDYYRALLGDHPIPTFASWREAAAFVRRVSARPEELDALQTRIGTWWESEKNTQRQRLAAFLSSPSYRSDLGRFAAKRRNRSRIVHQGLQIVELIRHQSLASLAYRIKVTAKRRVKSRAV